MNYTSYDEYMRSVLGYPDMRMNMNSNINMMNQCDNFNPYSDDLERMYPEVYRVVHPMVCRACDNVTMPVTEDMLDSMTDDIYDRVEADGRINIEVTVEAEFRDTESNSSESRQMSRPRPRPRRRNRFLRDLIRILLIRELLGRRRQRFPFRPF